MNFVTYEAMVRDAQALARVLPRDVVGVLGIPRSGMLPATVVASALGVHLGDPYSFARSGGCFMTAGRRMMWDVPHEGTVVVLDDSLYAGAAMESAMRMLRCAPALWAQFKFFRAVLYVEPGMEGRVDAYRVVLPSPRLFAWNWLGLESLGTAFLDMDGLVCEDPGVPDEDPDYERRIREAAPLHLPQRTVGAILTGRLRCWRRLTASWLEEHGVRARRLIHMPFQTAEARRRRGPARWKAGALRRLRPAYYLESDPSLAREIAGYAAGVCPIICPTTGEVWE